MVIRVIIITLIMLAGLGSSSQRVYRLRIGLGIQHPISKLHSDSPLETSWAKIDNRNSLKPAFPHRDGHNLQLFPFQLGIETYFGKKHVVYAGYGFNQLATVNAVWWKKTPENAQVFFWDYEGQTIGLDAHSIDLIYAYKLYGKTWKQGKKLNHVIRLNLGTKLTYIPPMGGGGAFSGNEGPGMRVKHTRSQELNPVGVILNTGISYVLNSVKKNRQLIVITLSRDIGLTRYRRDVWEAYSIPDKGRIEWTQYTTGSALNLVISKSLYSWKRK